MSKVDDFLKEFKKYVGKWTCSLHASNSVMPAGVFREVKKRGYVFEEVWPNRWAKEMFCPVCNRMTTHYKLLNTEPVLSRQIRLSITPSARKRTLILFDNRDAFTGATISSVAEIDHKVPWTRLEGDIDLGTLSDDEIRDNFQLLTREHNLLKDRACSRCKKENIRPPFLEIPFWYEGDEHYCGSCLGCGWYDGVEWRKAICKIIKNIISGSF